MVKLKRVIRIINKYIPEKLASDWDNSGLQIGELEQKISKVLLTLDVNGDVLNESIRKKCQLIISHHPFIFNDISSINDANDDGKIMIKAVKNNIAIYSAHTNLDIVSTGLNDYLADKLLIEDREILKVTAEDEVLKLVVFIPESHLEEVRETILNTNAGHIGNYSHSSFLSSGRGTFKPLAGSDPYLGKENLQSNVKEYRLETILYRSDLKDVINNMLSVHPYEEVAYDIYPLKNSGKVYGLGRVGYLQEEKPYQDVIDMIKDKLELDSLRYMGDLGESIKKIAICSGSGADYIQNAAFKGADLYLTGDIKLHDAQLAESLGLSLIDAGHYGTEVICVPYLYNLLKDEIEEKSLDFEVIQYKKSTDPLKLY